MDPTVDCPLPRRQRVLPEHATIAGVERVEHVATARGEEQPAPRDCAAHRTGHAGPGWQDHPAGGCRMGTDPATSVVDAWGRSHDHENLFVVGAPTCVSASYANGTLTFSALALRSAAAIAR